jgi:hypothetical protein
MNISLSELKTFERLSSSIKGNNILPVLDYVKMGDGKIIKSALHAFVKFDCPSADTGMLINEHLLSVKVEKSSGQFLNITKKANKVTLTDSITPTTFQVPDLKTFPVIPEPTSERFDISENFMRVLRLAQNFPLNPDAQNLSWMSFIMVGNGHICASDGHAFFMEPVEEEFEIVLDKKHAQAISKLPIKAYAYSDSYMFFYTDNSVIGFSRQEIGYSNIVCYGNINGSKMEFVGSANDFQNFNDECAQSSKEPWVSIKKGGISMNDSKRDIRLERSMENVTPSVEFTYNANTMNRLLTAVEGDEIEFYKGKDWYWIKSPTQKSTMLLMRLLEG